MNLPIATFSAGDVMRAARRCRMDLSSAVAQDFAADGAFAFFSTEWPTLPEANCVELTQPLDAGQIERIEAEFTSCGGRSIRWTSEHREDSLLACGALLREVIVMRLANWSAANEVSAAMILQARAAPAKMESLLREKMLKEDAIAAAMQHVDDSHDEWLVGLENGQPVVAAALLTSGDAGLLHDVHSVGSALADRVGGPKKDGPPGRTLQEGITRAVIDRLIEFAGRSGLKHVLVAAGAESESFYESIGFTEAGRWFEYTLPV